jgi:DNA mismatch endonuclease (patch repair protein)
MSTDRVKGRSRAGRLEATDPRNPAPSSIATRNVMRANRGSRTALELRVERYLRARGIRGLRTNWRTPLARADLAHPDSKVAIFVHGCFWHYCRLCQTRAPRSNASFWAAKFTRNRERDQFIRRGLKALGWRVVEIRECQARVRPWRQAQRVRLAIAALER